MFNRADLIDEGKAWLRRFRNRLAQQGHDPKIAAGRMDLNYSPECAADDAIRSLPQLKV